MKKFLFKKHPGKVFREFDSPSKVSAYEAGLTAILTGSGLLLQESIVGGLLFFGAFFNYLDFNVRSVVPSYSDESEPASLRRGLTEIIYDNQIHVRKNGLITVLKGAVKNFCEMYKEMDNKK